jgi:hypothetical protein
VRFSLGIVAKAHTKEGEEKKKGGKREERGGFGRVPDLRRWKSHSLSLSLFSLFFPPSAESKKRNPD